MGCSQATCRPVGLFRQYRVEHRFRRQQHGLGDKNKAAGSYARAINLRPKDEAARSGFGRVGGKPGQLYE